MTSTENITRIERSSSLDQALDLFLADIGAWANACVDRYADEPPIAGHDQLTYTTGWEPYLTERPDDRVARFLRAERDKVASYFATTDKWHHGYWRMQEAHHGTEHFELFLGFMMRVFPNDQETARQLIDAVEHIGNWSDEVPAWFDYSTGLFLSLYFGADGVRADPAELNMPDHLRCASLLLLAHEAAGDQRYLELAASYSERWALAVENPNTPLPIGIAKDGPVYDLSGPAEESYRSFAGMAGDLESDLDRAENILASGGVQLFLDMWRRTGNTHFLGATERLLDVLIDTITDPDAGPAADALRLYRRITRKTDFDSQVLRAVEPLDPHAVSSLTLELPQPLKKRPSGVGKRSDMPVWLEDGTPRRHDPILLALAAEITEDVELTREAVDLARAYFSLAVKNLPDGRSHGCAARSVSAVARGHGRNNHAGMTTAVLLPILQHFGIS